ncbi:hypothetical protein GOP47_0026762 [Adiantum capillus-veneris]|nr:hypothetical protein GOP47_0026762 [Adiantum capillus-veneris]
MRIALFSIFSRPPIKPPIILNFKIIGGFIVGFTSGYTDDWDFTSATREWPYLQNGLYSRRKGEYVLYSKSSNHG